MPTLERLLARPRLALARRVATRYFAVGGGTLAGGLAYALLFGLFSLLLAGASIAALALEDSTLRSAATRGLVELLPPLAPYVGTAVDAVASGAAGLSLGTLLTLVLGGARFYLTLESAIALLFHDGPRRSPYATALRALILPPVLSLALAALFLLAPAGEALLHWSAPQASLGAGLRTVFGIAPLALSALAVGLIYRYVPPRRPPLRSILQTTLAVTIGLGALGVFSASLSPWLIGILALYGAPLAVILGLVYLQLAATLILLGSAYLAEKSVPKDM